MKNFFLTLLITIGVISGGFYFLAFTQSGNDILLPLINKILKQNIKEADIKVEHFSLKPNHIEANASINKTAQANAIGTFDLFKKSFNITYSLQADKITSKDFKFNDKVYIKGVAVGDIKKMKVFGIGKVAKSDVEYKLDLIDNKAKNITAKIDKADLKKLLLLAGQKPYASGIVSLNANIPSFDKEHLKGSANISISKGVVNSKLVAKDFKVNLPKKTNFDISSKANLSGNIVDASAKVLTSLGNITSKKIVYNIKNNSLKSLLFVHIANLAKLNSITKMKMRGDLKANVDLKLKNNLLSALITTKSFGGKTTISYTPDKLKAIFKNVKTKAIFYKLHIQNYTYANLNGEVKIESLKKMRGKFSLNGSGTYKIDKQNIVKYKANTTGTIKNNKINAIANAKTNLGDIKLKKIFYDIQKATLSSLYTIYIDNLSRLNNLTGQRLRGTFRTDGEIKKDENFIVIGSAKKFDGDIKYKFINNKINATLKGGKLSKIQYTLTYPQMIDGIANANFDYDLKTSQGLAKVTIQKARMLPNQLTTLIRAFGGIDLTRQHYNDTKLIANITKSLIDFNFHAISRSVKLQINHGKIYQPSKRLNALLDARIEKNHIRLKIYGTTQNPKIKIDTATLQNRAKEKIKEKIKEKLEEKLKKELNIDKINKEEIIQGIFKKLL